jgi:hypothetical protein
MEKIRDWNEIVRMMEQGKSREIIEKYYDDTVCAYCKEYDDCTSCPLNKEEMCYRKCSMYPDRPFWVWFDWLADEGPTMEHALEAAKKIAKCVNENPLDGGK